MDIKTIFANRLKQLREENELSQSELGEQLGVSRGTISFYESQKRTADIEFLAAAAKFFGVDYDYLMGVSSARIGKSDAQKTLDDMGLSDNTIAFIKEQNVQYLTNPINILCGDNIYGTPAKSTVLSFFNSIMLYFFYSTKSEFSNNNIEELGIEPITNGIVLPFGVASEFFLQRAKELLSVILEYSDDVIPLSNNSLDYASSLLFQIFFQKQSVFKKHLNCADEEKYTSDFVNFVQSWYEQDKKVKNGIITEEQYIKWLQNIKEGETNGND